MTRRALKVYNALDLRYTPTEGTDAARKVDVDQKADKVDNATEGNLAALDSSGNLTDAGTSAGAITSAIDNHVNATTAHGSTATPTAERIAEYNSAGNLQSGSPTEDEEVTTRGFIAEMLRTTSLSIKSIPGTVVTVVIGSYSTTIAADADGFVNIETQHQGDTVITATYYGIEVARKTLVVYRYNRYEIDLEIPTFVLYGARHYVNESSPTLTRLADSANYTFTAESSTAFGGSDFDDRPIYKDIKTCVVDHDGNGNLVVTYEDDPGFSRTPASGDVCVEFPLFYYFRDRSHLSDATPYEDFYISDKKINDDFLPSPGHKDRGDGAGVREKIYISAYMMGESGRCVSGEMPASKTIATAEPLINRAHVHFLDVYADAMLKLLYIVQVSNLNSQSAIGQGLVSAPLSRSMPNGLSDDLFYQSGMNNATAPIVCMAYANNAVTSFSEGSYILDGTTVRRATEAFTKTTIEADRAKLEDMTYDSNKTYNAGEKVGYNGVVFRCLQNGTVGQTPEIWSDYWSCFDEEYDPSKTYKKFDGVIYNGAQYYATADTSGPFDSSKFSSSYAIENATKVLGIENYWGNTINFIDGVIATINNGQREIYVCDKISDYSRTESVANYTFLYSRSASSGIIKKVKKIDGYPELFLPDELGGSSVQNFCDYFQTNTTSSRFLTIGGGVSSGNNAGVFYCAFIYAYWTALNYRLMILP